LYSDDEEQLFDAVRPIVLNGITDFASRQDLVGRSVFVTLPPITEDRRRDEATFWAEFERERPCILGALLDIVSVALRNERSVVLASSPRMADFARWIVAAEPACPWDRGTFMTVYAGNRAEAIEATIDGDPLADYIMKLGAKRGTAGADDWESSDTWEGTARDLLQRLNETIPESVRMAKDWFKKPRQVADALRRLAPALRQCGIDTEFGKRQSRRRLIRITRFRLEQEGFPSSPSSPSSPKPKTKPISTISGDDAGDDSRLASPVASPEIPNKTGPGDAGDAGDDVKRSQSQGTPGTEGTWLDV
jgi:hypothetical protein